MDHEVTHLHTEGELEQHARGVRHCPGLEVGKNLCDARLHRILVVAYEVEVA